MALGRGKRLLAYIYEEEVFICTRSGVCVDAPV
jgi:hypothetical protein